jgi:hypothetical protein
MTEQAIRLYPIIFLHSSSEFLKRSFKRWKQNEAGPIITR